MCGIGANEYDLISSCESTKEIWNRLRIVYKGTEQTKKFKLDLFTTQFESFTIEEGESIQEMRTRFSTITNELMFLEEPVTMWKKVTKILEILPRSWIDEVDIVYEATDPEVLSLDALFEHLQVQEIHRRKDGLTFKGENKRRVQKALAVWGDSSSDSEESEHPKDVSMLAVKGDKDVFDATYSFMAKSDDEEVDEEVTLSDLKQNLHVYCVKKLRSLAALLIDSIIELTTENDLMNNSLDILHEEKVALVDQMFVVEEQLIVLEAENLELWEKLKMLSEKCGRGKGKASGLQIDLETSLNIAETKLAMALERNNQLEKDLVRVKEELNKSLKWTTSSKLLANLPVGVKMMGRG
ncbi:hypothetical protein KY285_013483 [Solanum tuberosum]|nr:hypothetical protein KY285_013483 [Solanum tuberosum]